MKIAPKDYPPGALFLYSEHSNPDLWSVDFDTRGLLYADKRIPACGNLYAPYAFELRGARSATILIFKEHANYPQTCNPAQGREDGPYRFYIELKTWKQSTNTGREIALDINTVLRDAFEGQVVAPGLVVRKVIRAADIEPRFDYKWWMGCIIIRSSG
jgi:hypothetical protein